MYRSNVKKLSGFFYHSMTSSTFICYGYLTVLRSVISKLWYRVKWCLRNVVLLMSMFAVHFCADTNERSKDRWNERQSDCIYCREKLWRSVKVLLFVKKICNIQNKTTTGKRMSFVDKFLSILSIVSGPPEKKMGIKASNTAEVRLFIKV